MDRNSDYDVIIIGAGIGGLAAGNILAKNGMKVLILEKNPAPGGGVSTFYRNGYPIDISHALCGLNEGAFLRNMLEYLGVYNRLELLKLENVFILMRESGQKPIFYPAGLDSCAQELKSYFPDEAKNIERLFKEITGVWNKELLRAYYNPPLALLLLYPILFPRSFRYRNYSFEQFLNRFLKSPDLKEAVSVGWPYLGMEKEYVSALYMICMLGAYHQDGSYFIKGGFGKLVEALSANFKELSGEVLLNTEAEKILLDNKKAACGVRDKKGNVYRGRIIVSNADSKKTFLDLLDTDCLPRRFLKKIDKMTMTRSAVQAHIFAEAEVSKEFLSCGSIILSSHPDLEAPLRKALKSNALPYEKPVLVLSIHPLTNFIADSSKNNFIFNMGWYPANYHLWKDFFESFGKEEYENIKREISQGVIEELKKIWQIKEIKFTNILTPLSFAKWLAATEGAIYDLALIPGQSLLNRLKHRTPIKNLYLLGTKTFPGNGIVGGTLSAFALGDILLKRKLTRGKMVF